MISQNLSLASLHVPLFDFDMVGRMTFRIRKRGNSQQGARVPATPEDPALLACIGSFKICDDLPDPLSRRQIVEMDHIMGVGGKSPAMVEAGKIGMIRGESGNKQVNSAMEDSGLLLLLEKVL